MKAFARTLTVAAALASALAVSPALAQKRGGWELIGSQQASDKAERDVVAVRGKERFRQIRLCAARRAVAFHDLDVVFANGGRQDVKIRRILAAGTCTRAIDLKGKHRDIRRIVMNYETVRDRGRQGVVSVFAR